jgi:GntR family transcriptional regulator, arabinose operon transcriptional repressor
MIRKDNLQPGDRLPSERELSKKFGLNHQTVRKGLAVLVEENVIDRRVGSGTYLRAIPAGSRTSSAGGGGPSAGRAEIRNRTFVGVMAFPKTGTFVTEMFGHLHDEAEKMGLHLSIRTIRDLGAKSREVAAQLVEQGCNSILLPWMPPESSVHDLLGLIQQSPVPIVLALSLPGLEDHCYEKPGAFGRADHLAVEMACRYLQALDYGHIALFGPDAPSTVSINHRVFAYNRFTSRQGLGSYVGLVNPGADDVDRIVKGWSSMAGDLAVLCYDDDFAIRLMTALHKFDLRIPEDVAVLGFNNIPLGESTDPPLSTIQFDYSYVARAMLEHAQAMARGESKQASGEAREILVIRRSCGGRQRAGSKLDEIIRSVQAKWSTPETRKS